MSRICATSCGWTPSTLKETIPARRSAGGPYGGHPGELGEPVERVGGELVLVLLDRLEPDSLEVVDRRAEPDRLGDRRACRPRTCAAARPRSSPRTGPCGSCARRVRNGSIASSSSARPQRAPMPLGPHILCAGEGEEVAAERLHVDRRWGAAWAASQTMIAPCSCAHAASLSTWLIVPSELETRPVRDDLHVAAAGGLVEQVEPQLAVVVEREHPEVGAGRSGDVLPRHEVRVVLELGDERRRRPGRGCQAPGVGDEVDPLGRVAGEDRSRGVDGALTNARHFSRARLERRGRALGELVDAAVDVRVRRLVEGASSRRAPAAASGSSRRSRGRRAAFRARAARRSGSRRAACGRRAPAAPRRP